MTALGGPGTWTAPPRPLTVPRRPRAQDVRFRTDARSLAVPGMLVSCLLVVYIALDLAIAALLITRRGVWTEWSALAAVLDDEAVVDMLAFWYADDIGLLAGLSAGSILMVYVTGPTFIWWFQRAYRNLKDRPFSAGWAYAGWFVPILNLWRPKQLANVIWRRSIGSALGFCVGWWWFGRIVAMGVAFVVVQVGLGSVVSGTQGEWVGVLLAGWLVLDASVAVALLVFVRAVTRAQEPLVAAARGVDTGAVAPTERRAS